MTRRRRCRCLPAVLGGTPIRTTGIRRGRCGTTTSAAGCSTCSTPAAGGRATASAATLRRRVRRVPRRPLRPGAHQRHAHARGCADRLRHRRGRRGGRPGMTFVASASAVLAVNATPVLVDIDADTLCIDPAAAEAAITDTDPGDRRRPRGGRGGRPRCAHRTVPAARSAPDRGLRPRPRHLLARPRRRLVGRLRELLDAALEADDRRRGRGADLQRRGAARRGLGLRRLRPGRGRVVLPPRHATARTCA